MDEKIFEKNPTIGRKEIIKNIKDGNISIVIVASNCPKEMIDGLGDVTIESFEGNQKDLGTKLGKPFPIAMVGFE